MLRVRARWLWARGITMLDEIGGASLGPAPRPSGLKPFFISHRYFETMELFLPAMCPSRRWIHAALVACLTCISAAVFGATAWATFPGANGRIAYGGKGGLHTILPSGSGDKLIAPNAGFPAWAPSGKRLAVVRLVDGQQEIYSMAEDGSNMRRLTHNDTDDVAPSYSPGGNKIAFSGIAGIVVMQSDGSDQRVLSRRGSRPTYSPNQNWIAFLVGSTANHNASIWVMHRNGSDEHRLLFLGSEGGWIGGYSPDGRKIAFSRCAYRCRYFVAKADGTNVRPLPCPADYYYGTSAPLYSPSGRRLLGETSGLKLVTVPLHSCSPSVVVSLRANDAALPDWQPLPNTR